MGLRNRFDQNEDFKPSPVSIDAKKAASIQAKIEEIQELWDTFRQAPSVHISAYQKELNPKDGTERKKVTTHMGTSLLAVNLQEHFELMIDDLRHELSKLGFEPERISPKPFRKTDRDGRPRVPANFNPPQKIRRKMKQCPQDYIFNSMSWRARQSSNLQPQLRRLVLYPVELRARTGLIRFGTRFAEKKRQFAKPLNPLNFLRPEQRLRRRVLYPTELRALNGSVHGS